MTRIAALGIDVGGTKTLCVLTDSRCRILNKVKFKTAPHEGRHQFTQNLVEAVTALQTDARKKKLTLKGVGVGCAGLVDLEKIKIKTSPNLLILENYPIGKYLGKALRAKVWIGNDVQLGIYAEHQLGAAVGCSHVLGAFFGTGVGGAAIINNKVYTGASGFGGQIGSLLAQPVGGPQAALSHGILDRIASKAAIASEALVMAIKNWAPYLHGKVDNDLSKVTWGVLKRAIDHGDERIEEMLRARMRVVGIALSNIVNFLNPQMVVLGGGLVSEMPKLVLSEIRRGLEEYLVPEIRDVVKIRPAKLGGAAVALGAAHLALTATRKGVEH
jgi:glucokinase